MLDAEGRYIILTCDINEQPYILVALYTPNSHQLCFLCKLFFCIKAIRYGNLLMCGDFNLTTDPLIDSTAVTGKRIVSLHSLLHKEDVYDAWRCQYASEREYTFFSLRHHTYSHIDMFLTDKWLLQRVSMTRIYDITWLDHAAISLIQGLY